MIIAVDLDPELEQLAKARAEAQGVSVEGYLSLLVAQKVQQDVWEEDDASLATVAGSASTMRRIWDTPVEDAAWKHLEDL